MKTHISLLLLVLFAGHNLYSQEPQKTLHGKTDATKGKVNAVPQSESPKRPIADVPQPPTPEEIHNILRTIKSTSLSDRAKEISAKFLGIPYGTVCGDGSDGDFDQRPLTCFDKFNCTTYVEAVLALALTKKEETPELTDKSFNENLKKIKYCNPNDICYKNRNHFVCLDWLPSQVSNGFLKDITTEIEKTASKRRVYISKRDWYAGKKVGDIFAPNLSASDKRFRLSVLNSLGADIADQHGEMSYIALEDLLKEETQKLIPDFAVFNLIKGDFRNAHIPVVTGHQGFIVRKNGKLYLRHATPSKAAGQKVADVDFEEYIKERTQDRTWPTLGLNINGIGPEEAEETSE